LKKKNKKNNKSKQDSSAKEAIAGAVPVIPASSSDLPEPPPPISNNSITVVDAAGSASAADSLGTGGKKCNTCGGSFDEAGYRAHFRWERILNWNEILIHFHFRSDWHRYNLRRKMKALTIVTESEYALLPIAEKNLTVDDRWWQPVGDPWYYIIQYVVLVVFLFFYSCSL
jgi:hypothetical protein